MRVLSGGRLSCAALLVAVLGCGGPDGDAPDLVPVSGTVTLDGEPVSGVMVNFFPEGPTTGSTLCYGMTDDSGRYELQDSQGRKGTLTGKARVTCSKFVMPDGSPFTSDGEMSPEMAGAVEVFPPRYSDETRTELEVDVPAGGDTFDFDLESE